MLASFKVVKCQAKELIIQLFFGTEGFLFMVVMMGKRDLETCINAVSKTRNTNGKRSRAMVYKLNVHFRRLEWS
jgi:hypothetical protein